MAQVSPMKRHPDWIGVIIAFLGGISAGWIDFNNDEPQAAVLVVLVVTFLLGFMLPKKAWLWAIIVALCIPGIYLFAHGAGLQPVSPPIPGWYASVIALIPGFIGAYAGVLGRMIIDRVLAGSRKQ